MDDVIVFGRGWYFKAKKDGIYEKYHVSAFLDNSVLPENEDEEDGVPVFHPSQVFKIPEIPILLMSFKYIDMWKQLMCLGIEPGRILFGMQIPPYYEELENMLAEWHADIRASLNEISIECGEEKYYYSNEEQYKRIIRRFYQEKYPFIRAISEMPVTPSSRRFGVERGKPVDRYYIEKFLKENQSDIHGDVMEIAENSYTKKFGSKVDHEYILHVNGWGQNVIKGNLETGEGIIENSIDCFICTQTLHSIYRMHDAIRNIHKLLKPNGVALITVQGVGELSLYDYWNWGEYARFTDQLLSKALGEVFTKDNIRVSSYGNVKTAVSMLYGLCVEELDESDFKYNDVQYQVIVVARVKKEC